MQVLKDRSYRHRELPPIRATLQHSPLCAGHLQAINPIRATIEGRSGRQASECSPGVCAPRLHLPVDIVFITYPIKNKRFLLTSLF